MDDMKILEDGKVEITPAVVKTAEEVLAELDVKIAEYRKDEAIHMEIALIDQARIAELEAKKRLIQESPLVALPK